MDTSSFALSWMSLALAVDPTNAARVYVGMGGGQWTSNATAASPCWVRNAGGTSDCGIPFTFNAGHVDMNDFMFVPGQTKVLIANDGGVFEHDWSDNSIDDLGNDLGFATVQAFSNLTSLAVAKSDVERLLLGTQDNGSVRADGASALLLYGGDGGQANISPDDADEMVYSWGIAPSRVYSDSGGFPAANISCGMTNNDAAILRDPTPGLNPSDVFLFTLAPNGGAGDFVWFKPPDGTCDWAVAHAAPLPFAARQLDQNNDPLQWTLYVTGAPDRRVAVFDGGSPGSMTWQLRTPAGIDPPLTGPGADVRVYADRSDSRTGVAYYTTGRASPSRAFVTVNRGVTWREVTGNLARISGETDLLEMVADPRTLDTLFVATDIGVFRTDSGLAPYPIWYRFMEGLPAVVAAFGLEVVRNGAAAPQLTLATYGQGVWERLVEETAFVFADGFEAGSTIAWSSHLP
jgi:hypothetical protein